MEEIKKRNIDFLAEYYPALLEKLNTIDTSGDFSFVHSPRPNIYFHEKPLHSPLNPEQEAENLLKNLRVEEGLVFIFLGLGLGYHLKRFKELYQKKLENITIIVVERSIEIFSFLVGHGDISFLLNTHLFVGERSGRLKDFFAALNPLAFKGYRIIKLRGDFSLFHEYYSEIEYHFKETMSGKLSDVLTRFAFESLWMKNIVENLPSFVGKQPISVLKGVLSQKPALVLGAGPSLYTQLGTIRRISRNIHIIAVDTALAPLLQSGIEPDFVVTLDAQFFSIHDFHLLFSLPAYHKKINLIADVVVYPKIVKQWRGALFFSETALPFMHENRLYRESHPLMTRFKHYFPHMDSLECGGSVATTAIEFALYLGARPVLVSGLDLAYTHYATHVNSSTHYTLFYNGAHRLRPLSSMMVGSIRKRRLCSTEGIHGNRVLSDFVFENYRSWIQQKKAYQNAVYNVTADGVKIPGLRHINLEELLNDMNLKEKKGSISHPMDNRLEKNTCHGFLTVLKDDIVRAKRELQEIPQTDKNMRAFIQAFPFLRNNVLEATVLYPDSEKAITILSLFLSFMEKKIDRSIKKVIEHNSHR